MENQYPSHSSHRLFTWRWEGKPSPNQGTGGRGRWTESFDLAPAIPGEAVLKWSMEVAFDYSKLEASRVRVWNFTVTECVTRRDLCLKQTVP